MTTSSGGPEYLDASGPAQPAVSSNDRRKRLIALGAVVGAGAVVAGGAWAATSFFATGAQPAEALPASTIAYVSIDLDPSGSQKVEAIRTLRKFPAFKDKINLDTDDDLRERMFEEITESGECEGLDYAKDVEPWLGSRGAFAVVDTGGETPSPVGVIQVTDAGAADEGIAHLVETCGGGSGDGADTETGGWVVEGDWVVVAESEDVAQKVVDAAAEGDLASDESFTTWTGETGDDGILTMYISQKATDYLEDLMAFGGSPLGMAGVSPMVPELDEDYSDELGEGFEEEFSEPTPGEVPQELREMLDKFEGAAATVRFDDGALEVEFAASNYQEELTQHFTSDTGVDLVGTLPEGTVAAFGLGFEDGWAQGLIDYFATFAPEDQDVDELIAEAEAETGLELPDDIETLVGEGVAIGLGEGIDPDAIANGGPAEIPFGLKIAGDADDIQAVLDKLKEQAGPEVGPYLEVVEGDGNAVLSPHEDYRAELEKSGSLGDSAAYEEVVESDDAQSVLFVNFDADDDWLVRVAGDDAEVSDNLAPLSAFGMSSWIDGDVAHGLIKLTTD